MDPVFLLTVLFIIGLVVEAMTGAITAGEMRMDLFGVLVVANVTAFGGGVIRDLLLGRSPMLIIDKPELLVMTSIAALIMVMIARYFRKLSWLFLSLDALGLITFSIVGAMRAMDMGFGMGVASIAGITTGVFGGILRDMLCNRIPLAFQKELYASVSIASVWLYLILHHYGVAASISVTVTLIFGFCLRMLAVKYDWNIPRFVYEAKMSEQ
jgi:uncharacterized membrane protein YeiH